MFRTISTSSILFYHNVPCISNYRRAAVALEKRRAVVTSNVVDGPNAHGALDGLQVVSTSDLEEQRDRGKEKRWRRGGGATLPPRRPHQDHSPGS